jgi:hypothetical protein
MKGTDKLLVVVGGENSTCRVVKSASWQDSSLLTFSAGHYPGRVWELVQKVSPAQQGGNSVQRERQRSAEWRERL